MVNNWYKKISQTQEELLQQYSELQNSGSINITGAGQSESIKLPQGNMINAGDLLRQAINKIQPILIQNGVREIDTSPIYSHPQAQGLAVSHEAGKIHIDLQKIVNQAQQSLPPISQLDSVQPDPDITQNIVSEVSNYLLQQIGETVAHESFHAQQYRESLPSGEFKAEEYPAEQYGRQISQQYFN